MPLPSNINAVIKEHTDKLLQYLDSANSGLLEGIIRQTQRLLDDPNLERVHREKLSALDQCYTRLKMQPEDEFEILGAIEVLHKNLLEPSTTKAVVHNSSISNDNLELLGDFTDEAIEQLQLLSSALLILDNNPQESNMINQAFRALHTLKGGAGFIGAKNIVNITHLSESLLSNARNGTHILQKKHVSVLLKISQRLEEAVITLQQTRQNHADFSDLSLALREFETIPQTQAASSFFIFRPHRSPLLRESIPLIPLFIKETQAGLETYLQHLLTLQQTPYPQPNDQSFRFVHNLKNTAQSFKLHLLFHLSFASEQSIQELQKPQPEQSQEYLYSLIAIAQEIQRALSALQTLIQTDPIASSTTETTPPINSAATVRVPIEVLDRLMRLSTELLIHQHRLSEPEQTKSKPTKSRHVSHPAKDINTLSHRIQDTIATARLQPLSLAFRRLNNIIRDVANATGKNVSLDIEGEDLSVDKYILDSLQSPLIQIVRNAVDHGIESPERRMRIGKPQVGKISIQARLHGSQCRITILDDGIGLNRTRIRATAMEKGLYTEEELTHFTDLQILNLIFLPGFSTRREVSSISGRGVGMDIVKRKIEQLRGVIYIESTQGRGTRFTIEVPLSLSLIPALQLDTISGPILILQHHVQEIRKPKPTEITHREGRDLLVYHSESIPLLRLSSILGQERPEEPYVIICRVNEELFGLYSSSPGQPTEILLEPPHPLLKKIEIYQGTTLLANGCPALILNLPLLAARHHLLGHHASLPTRTPTPLHFYLLFSVDNESYALPLHRVIDLERFQSHRFSLDAITYQKGHRTIPIARSLSMASKPKYILFLKSVVEYALPVQEIFEIYSSNDLPSPSPESELLGILEYKKRTIPILDPIALYSTAP
ncbi:MAG: chemotaxis protein CheA [Myxococcota bacterium]|nr:chemotaxis protein CheA [Myxococcota bacterium]